MTLQNGDICLVDGCSGIYYNGQITLSNLTVTDKEPDYVLRFDGEITSDPERISLPVLEFGAVGLYVGILQACLRFHGIRIDIDGVLGHKHLQLSGPLGKIIIWRVIPYAIPRHGIIF